MNTKLYDILELQKLNHLELLEIAAQFEIPEEKCKYKQETIYAILDAQQNVLDGK